MVKVFVCNGRGEATVQKEQVGFKAVERLYQMVVDSSLEPSCKESPRSSAILRSDVDDVRFFNTGTGILFSNIPKHS